MIRLFHCLLLLLPVSPQKHQKLALNSVIARALCGSSSLWSRSLQRTRHHLHFTRPITLYELVKSWGFGYLLVRAVQVHVVILSPFSGSRFPCHFSHYPYVFSSLSMFLCALSILTLSRLCCFSDLSCLSISIHLFLLSFAPPSPQSSRCIVAHTI